MEVSLSSLPRALALALVLVVSGHLLLSSLICVLLYTGPKFSFEGNRVISQCSQIIISMLTRQIIRMHVSYIYFICAHYDIMVDD